MTTLIFDKDTIQKLSSESYELPSIEVTLVSSFSCEDGISLQKHQPEVTLPYFKNHEITSTNKLCSLLKQSYLGSKITAPSLNKSGGDCRSDSKKTMSSNIAEWHSSEFDWSHVSDTDSEGHRFANITAGMSKSMCQTTNEHGTPNKLFLSKEALRPEFIRICQDFLLEQSYSKKITDSWNIGKLFTEFRSLPFANPFIETPLLDKSAQLETVCTLFESWLFNYPEYKDLIFSFDYTMNHPSLILSLVFYWIKSEDPVSPFVSASERSHITQQKNTLRSNILKIVADEITVRARELNRNIILVKLLSEFLRYITDNPPSDMLPSLPEDIIGMWKILTKQTSVEEEIRKNMSVETKHEADLLERVYDNYQNRDKLIKDKLSDVVEVFTETDKSLILLTSLSDYFQKGLGENSLIETGNRYNRLSCWLLSMVVNKIRTNGRQAIEYVIRYIQLLKEFDRIGNYQSAILFGGLISNIRIFMSNLWKRTTQTFGNADIERELDRIIEHIQRPIFNEKIENANILFSNTDIYKLIETTRAKFHKMDLTLNFHKRIQTIGKNIQACRRLLEEPYRTEKKFSKMNLNQRFIGTYVHEILKRESKLEGSHQFEELKKEAKKFDKDISFSLLNLY